MTGLTANQIRAGARTLSARVSFGCSRPVSPITEKVKARGKQPTTNAERKILKDILDRPAIQETTSGIIGNHLDRTTIQPPVVANMVLLFSRAAAPAILSAILRPKAPQRA